MSNESYSVYLGAPGQLEIPKIGQAIARAKKILLPDATMEAKTSWGHIGHDLSSDEADQLLAELHSAGLVGKKILTSSIPVLPPAALVHSFAMTDQTCDVMTKAGQKTSFAWSDVLVIAAGGFNESTTKMVKEVTGGRTAGQQIASLGIMLATGLPIQLGEKEKVVQKEKKTNEFIFALDLITRTPLFRARLFSHDFDFGGLGDKKTVSGLSNFRELVNELSTRAPAALHSRGTDILLQSKPVIQMGYDMLGHLEKESQWLLTLALS